MTFLPNQVSLLEFDKKFQKSRLHLTDPFRYQLYHLANDTFFEFTDDHSYIRMYDKTGQPITDLFLYSIRKKYCMERWLHNGLVYIIASSVSDVGRIECVYSITKRSIPHT